MSTSISSYLRFKREATFIPLHYAEKEDIGNILDVF